MARWTRVVGAVLSLVGGAAHLWLYRQGYRDVPNANLGRSFLAHAAASGFVAGLLVLAIGPLWRKLSALAGIGLAVGGLAAIAISRTSRGLFGFTEHGLQPAPEGLIVVGAEIGMIVALAMSIVIEWRQQSPRHHEIGN